MIDRAPEGSSWVAWLAVMLWSVFIWFTVPLARMVQRFVTAHWGRLLFMDVVLAAIVLAAGFSLLFLVRRKQPLCLWNVAALLTVTGVFVWQTVSLRAIPDEAIHFVEYGVLSFLAFHAFSYRTRDLAVYALAVLLTALVGVADEILQWLTPERVFDFRDIRLNAMAGVLVQAGLAFGLKPAIIAFRWSAGSTCRVCRWAAVLVLFWGGCYLNTPRWVERYTRLSPMLDYLRYNDNAMSEYGFLHVDPEIGTFKSRFNRAVLRAIDERRGREVAPLLDRYCDPRQYRNFLTLYTPVTDPFAHETRVHLFRRDHYLTVLWKHRNRPDDYRLHATVAFYENRILEKYFSNTYHASRYVWDEAIKNRLADLANPVPDYVSPVSRALITRFSERTVTIVMMLLWMGLGWACWLARRRLRLAAVLLMACGWWSFAARAEDAQEPSLRLVFFADVHTRTEWETPKALEMAADAINAQAPDLIVGGGDYITEGFESRAAKTAPRWNAFFDRFHNKLESPVWPVIGNHDLVAAHPADGSAPNPEPREEYLRRFALTHTWWSAETGGYHFVFLDTIQVSGDSNRYVGAVDPVQLDWLRRDLQSIPPDRPVIAVTHMPLYTTFYGTNELPANRVVVNRREVLDVLRKNNLILVLQGHMHIWEKHVLEAATVITGGAVCGKWWRGSWQGTPEGFCVIRLKGDQVDADYVGYGWKARRPKDE